MSGILYICGTPIGNLEDITFRAIRILKEVDLIAAEDTRHSIKLLNYYEIKTPLTSYHEHNKMTKGDVLLKKLLEGKNIALISDAGMPGISDPGEDLIKLCYKNNIKVTTVPGPTAVITGLILSGLSTRRYVFEGFLPSEKKEKNKIFEKFINETRTIVFYESPHHIIKTLSQLAPFIGERKVSILRELTKQYEEMISDNINKIIEYFINREPRGEFVVVIEGQDETIILESMIKKWNEISIEEHLNIYLNNGKDKKESMKHVAKDRGVSKRDIYNYFLKK